MLMKSITSSLLLATVAIGAYVPDRLDPYCRTSCGRALTSYNKCKGSQDFNTCLCDEDSSRFVYFLDKCLQCGPAIWPDYGRALRRPMRQCRIRLPFQVPQHRWNSTTWPGWDDYGDQDGHDSDNEDEWAYRWDGYPDEVGHDRGGKRPPAMANAKVNKTATSSGKANEKHARGIQDLQARKREIELKKIDDQRKRDAVQRQQMKEATENAGPSRTSKNLVDEPLSKQRQTREASAGRSHPPSETHSRGNDGYDSDSDNRGYRGYNWYKIFDDGPDDEGYSYYDDDEDDDYYYDDGYKGDAALCNNVLDASSSSGPKEPNSRSPSGLNPNQCHVDEDGPEKNQPRNKKRAPVSKIAQAEIKNNRAASAGSDKRDASNEAPRLQVSNRGQVKENSKGSKAKEAAQEPKSKAGDKAKKAKAEAKMAQEAHRVKEKLDEESRNQKQQPKYDNANIAEIEV